MKTTQRHVNDTETWRRHRDMMTTTQRHDDIKKKVLKEAMINIFIPTVSCNFKFTEERNRINSSQLHFSTVLKCLYVTWVFFFSCCFIRRLLHISQRNTVCSLKFHLNLYSSLSPVAGETVLQDWLKGHLYKVGHFLKSENICEKLEIFYRWWIFVEIFKT